MMAAGDTFRAAARGNWRSGRERAGASLLAK